MYEVIFLLVFSFIWLIFASTQDLRTREVADWLNFSLMIFALGFRFFYSLFYLEDFNFFYQGLIGLGIFFIIGNLFYYGRIFAGGDAKLMISLGTILPFSNNFFFNLNIFALFILIFLFTGLVYSLSWSVFITFQKFNLFKKEFKNQWRKNKTFLFMLVFLGIILIILGFINFLFFLAGIFFITFPFLIIYAKSIDESCMVKEVKPGMLTVGDWLYQDVKIGKKTIKANWDGLTKEEIQILKKNKKNVLIRHGIPFVPVFLISFLILIFLYLRGLTNLF